jgi:hypothetical protein
MLSVCVLVGGMDVAYMWSYGISRCMRGVINVNSQVLNYHSFIINTIFVSDPRVSCALFRARTARRQGPDNIRLPPRRRSSTPSTSYIPLR